MRSETTAASPRGMAGVATQERPLSRLEILPAEIRVIIYRYAVAKEKGIWATKRDHGSNLHRLAEPPLAMACKQVREEVLPIFFAENDFVLAMCKCSQCCPDACSLSSSIAQTGMTGWLRAVGKHVSLVNRIGVLQLNADSTLPPKRVGAVITGTQVKFRFSKRFEDICRCGFERLEKTVQSGERGTELIKSILELCLEQFQRVCTCSGGPAFCSECDRYYYRQ